MGGACSKYGERRGKYRILVWKLEEKRPLGGSRRRWEDNIMIDLQEVGWEAWTVLIWLGTGTSGKCL